MGTADRSPLPWRSGDSELLPLGESSPDGGDKLRSTRGAAEKRPSTFSGNLGFSRKPEGGEPGEPGVGLSSTRPSSLCRARCRTALSVLSRFSLAARSLVMLSFRSSGSSKECMVVGAGSGSRQRGAPELVFRQEPGRT